MQRKLKIYLQREKAQFKLHIVQIEENKAGGAGHQNGHIDPMIWRMFFYKQNFFDFLRFDLARFNGLSTNSTAFQSLYETFYSFDDEVDEVVIDQCDRNAAYSYKSAIFIVPMNPVELFKLLGVLDSSIHLTLRESKNNNEVTGIEYCDKLPDFTRKHEICHYALERIDKEPLLPAKHLSRHVAEWIVDELSCDMETMITCRPLLECLSEMLEKEAGSLTPCIRQFLYPVPPVVQIINQYCQDADPLTRALLNPALSLTERTENLLKFVRETLGKKPKINKVEPVDNADVIQEKENQIKTIHAELKKWFDRLDAVRKTLWSHHLANLYGRLADDQGYYNSRYTEVTLLREARFVVNANGLVQVHFFHTDSYQENYSSGQPLFNKLETELRAACGDLDLHFLPDQDFHQQAVFDGPSSARLKERGYHFNAKWCKDQLRDALNMRLFQTPVEAGYANAFSMFGRDVHKLLLQWVNEGYHHEADLKIKEETEAGIRLIGRGFRLVAK